MFCLLTGRAINNWGLLKYISTYFYLRQNSILICNNQKSKNLSNLGFLYSKFFVV